MVPVTTGEDVITDRWRIYIIGSYGLCLGVKQLVCGLCTMFFMIVVVAEATPLPILYEIQPGIMIVGWERLSSENQNVLRHILNTSPRALAPWLRIITIDNAPIPEPYASEECWPNGVFLSQRPCGFNILSAGESLENQFPADAPVTQWVQIFTAITIHEYGHQIGQGTDTEQGWVDGLISEAGDEPIHYLRSMIQPGYFRQYPQEFIASMWNQWGTCSLCTLRLALVRWDTGNPHPLNQVILLLALSGFRHGLLDDHAIGTVIAHRMQDEVPAVELWSVWPWRCGGASQISSPDLTITITTDTRCRVVKVIPSAS